MQHRDLSRYPEVRFPDGLADVRGFEVRTRDDERVGKIDDLICSGEGKIRYLNVDLGGFFTDKHVAVPIGAAKVDREGDVVRLTELTKDQIKDLPEYSGDASSITNEFEGEVLRACSTNAGAGRPAATAARTAAGTAGLYDQGRFYAERGGEAAREARLVLSEEQLKVGKRQVQAGDVGIRKTIETEHVQETVPLVHDEAFIERRPITNADASNAQIKEQEIRVPLMAEEAVVEKRTVGKEEVVLKKRQVTENKTVEADVRRERLDESGMRGASSKTTDQAPVKDPLRDDRRDRP